MKTYIAIACFDADSEKILFQHRRKLSSILSLDLAGDWKPHITLGCYTLKDLNLLLNWTANYVKRCKKMKIEFNSLGFFLHNKKYPKTDVIYTAPAITPELYRFYVDYHKMLDEFCIGIGWDYSMSNGNPTIHSTISICKTEEFQKAITYMYNSFRPFTAQIISIEIYEPSMKLIKRYKIPYRKEMEK